MILFKSKNITFVHDYSIDNTKTTTLPLGISNLASSSAELTRKKPRILCYPPKDALRGDVSYATHTKVNERQTFEVGWTSGWNTIHDCELRLKSASAGLRLFTAEASRVRGDIKISDAPQTGVIRFSPMVQQQQHQQQQPEKRQLSAQFSVPYDLESAPTTNMIAIGMDLVYRTDEGEFKLMLDATLSTELPLAVNVYDIFKEAMLVSRFQIQTSSASRLPVQVTGLELDGFRTECVVKAPSRMPLPVDVLPGQPLWATYMIAKKDDDGGRGGNSGGSRKDTISSNGMAPLSLVVRYRHFTAIVMRRIELLFSKDLMDSLYGRFKWLLLPRLLERVQEDLGNGTGGGGVMDGGFSTVAMTNEVRLGPYERFNWTEICRNVALKDREVLRLWLQEWHRVSLVRSFSNDLAILVCMIC